MAAQPVRTSIAASYESIESISVPESPATEAGRRDAMTMVLVDALRNVVRGAELAIGADSEIVQRFSVLSRGPLHLTAASLGGLPRRDLSRVSGKVTTRLPNGPFSPAAPFHASPIGDRRPGRGWFPGPPGRRFGPIPSWSSRRFAPGSPSRFWIVSPCV